MFSPDLSLKAVRSCKTHAFVEDIASDYLHCDTTGPAAAWFLLHALSIANASQVYQAHLELGKIGICWKFFVQFPRSPMTLPLRRSEALKTVGIVATPIGYHWPIRSIVRGGTALSSLKGELKS